MKSYISFFLFLGIFCFTSCGNETETLDGLERGFEFAPLEVGNYWIYESDSIVYRQGGNIIDSLSGFIKEEIIDTFRDEENLLNFKVQRSFKRVQNDLWKETDLWFSSKSGSNYVRIEENLKFISLIFPITEGANWDGNAFFDENVMILEQGELLQPYKNWDYEYQNVDTSYNNGQISSDEVIFIEHIDDDIIIEKRVSKEMYAKGIGLVQKEMSILECQPCAGNPGSIDEEAELGYKMSLKLIDYN